MNTCKLRDYICASFKAYFWNLCSSVFWNWISILVKFKNKIQISLQI